MSDDKPKRPALLLGDDFGDDDEATAVDFSVDDELKRSLKKVREGADDEDDEDDPGTEILRPLPQRADLPPTAQKARGVVALDDDSKRLVGQSGKHPASPPRGPGRGASPELDDDEDAETVQLSRPPSLARDGAERPPESETAPRVRPLDDVAPPIADWDPADDKTLSRPKVVRMTFSPAKHPPPGGSGKENTTTRPRGAARGDGAGPEDDTPGRLVVQAPKSATVFVDGVERGRGTVTLDDVDRHARLSVRVHQPGCRPWTRAVTLAGTAELKVSATPEPR